MSASLTITINYYLSLLPSVVTCYRSDLPSISKATPNVTRQTGKHELLLPGTVDITYHCDEDTVSRPLVLTCELRDESLESRPLKKSAWSSAEDLTVCQHGESPL